MRVHLLVRGLSGEILADTEIWHIYTITNGLIERMDIEETEAISQQTPSSAFTRH